MTYYLSLEYIYYNCWWTSYLLNVAMYSESSAIFFLQMKIRCASSNNFGIGASTVFEWFHHISFCSHFWCNLKIIFCPCSIKCNCGCLLICDANFLSILFQTICSSSGLLIDRANTFTLSDDGTSLQLPFCNEQVVYSSHARCCSPDNVGVVFWFWVWFVFWFFFFIFHFAALCNLSSLNSQLISRVF